MVYPELPHDVNSPTHPVSAMDYMPVEPLRALQLHRLQWTVKYAYERVPLFRKRCEERGVRPEHIKTLADIKLLPFSKKTDLRDEYPMGLRGAPMDEIVRFHCSSGTTGKPICIPNTMQDIEVWKNGAMRCLTMYGIRAGDVIQVAYGYGLFTGGLGLHYGGEGLGCAVLPISGGNTERQIMLMRDLGVTAIAATPSYFLRIMDEAKKQGVDFRRDTKLRHGIFGAEPWTDEMRETIERETGIIAHDIYGLTEISGPGVAGACPHRTGLHIWEDHFYPEIIDPDTLEPLPDGEIGELVFREVPVRTHHARDGPHLRPFGRHAHHPRRERVPGTDRGRTPPRPRSRPALPDRPRVHRHARPLRDQGGGHGRGVLGRHPPHGEPPQARPRRREVDHRPHAEDLPRGAQHPSALGRQDQARHRQQKEVIAMTINQISVFLENRPGQLANICRTLANADISIVTLSLADTAEFGIVRMIVSDHDKAKEVLKKAGHVANMREVVAVTVPDRPGGMAEILDVLDAAKVDIEYSYAFAFHHGEKAVLVFRFDDNEKACAALAAAGHPVLDYKSVLEEAK